MKEKEVKPWPKNDTESPFKTLPHRASVIFTDKDGGKRGLGSSFSTKLDAKRAEDMVEAALRTYKGQV